jgi:hypothetical protein
MYWPENQRKNSIVVVIYGYGNLIRNQVEKTNSNGATTQFLIQIQNIIKKLSSLTKNA